MSPATLAAAAEARRAVETISYLENFGDLRRAEDLPHLTERLQAWSLSIEDYGEAIERSCSRDGGGRGLAERLAEVRDVVFAGSDDSSAPSDDTDFRSDGDLENEVEDPYVALRDEPGSGSVSCDGVSLSRAAAGEQDAVAVVVQVAEPAA